MTIKFGFGIDARGAVPAVEEYDTIEWMQSDGYWATLTPAEQARVTAYMEGPIGRLLCALRDAERAAVEMGGEREKQCMVGIWEVRRFAEKALAEVGR